MTTTLPRLDDPRAAARARPGPLGRLAGLAYRRRGRVLLAWAAAFAIAFGVSAAFGGDFTADYSAPGSDSKAAQDLLAERFPARAGDTVDVVVHADGPVTDPGVRGEVTALLGELTGMPHVAAVDDPYSTPGAVSADGRTLLARLNLDVANPVDMPVADTERLLAAADEAARPGLDVALGGQAIQLAEASEVGSEGIGLLAAAVILLITFGSVVAAGLPIGVALAGLAVSGVFVGAVARLMDVPDWSPVLGSMLGIALGIDYTLLMVTRFREWRAAGLDPEAATVATLETAGRSVLVAGATVMVSMLGLFAMGLSFMSGASAVTMVAVFVVVAAALTLFPALLGYLGRWVDRLRLPLRRRATTTVVDGHLVPARGWTWWSRLVGRHRVLAAVTGTALLLLLAVPFLGVHIGFPDAGNDPEGTSNRRAYEVVADGFGPGANGPLVVVADVSGVDAGPLVSRLADDLAATPGVAAVAPPQLNPAGDAAMLMVVPTTGPQAAATEDLVRTIRDDVIPDAGARAHVGGVTATAIDSNVGLAKRLPLLIGGVVLLSMLLLLVSFRSLLIPLTAALMNLLSVAAAYGVVAYVLEGGWAGQLIGIDTPTPMAGFIPVIMFAILFGLSMDYQVFLLSRMRETWVKTGDNGRAVLAGLAGTGRVITAAAAIMIAVFAAFVPISDVAVKVLGFGMAVAILIDATVVRMLLVPAVMHLLGRANWWLPARLDRSLPQLHVEGRPDVGVPAAPFRHSSEDAALRTP
ncbi:MMPL family transporter [Micromonospora sp. CPCC 205371]|nr:MMPL family transporter [Micromonospora sp. CPCC 205371]